MFKFRKSAASFVVVTLLAMSFTPLQRASALVEWALAEDAVALGLTGVSPHVERTGNADRLWYPSLAGTIVSDCTDAGACTSVPVTGRLGSDFTAVTLPNGTRRAYFVETTAGATTKSVSSAACLTTACTAVGTSTVAAAELVVSQNVKAWGVPDAVVTPDGKVRLYVVESPVEGNCTEKLASYISSDGISFTKEAGWRLENGISVDPEILRAKTGDWLMILADGPGCSDRVQKLYISTSNDGLTWSTPQKISGSDLRRLDPTGYEVSTNVFRIYYATAVAGALGDVTYTIKRGTIAIKQSSAEVSITTGTTASAKSTITCIKGKLTKKVTGLSPKCPSGYKKK
ncbi:hypothetical protein EMGBS4_18470 [Acidimicrobiaceae bacterium]|nr:hypothetical protein EMGBS4_18470 [Acidimicrobiaceae bacterium]